MTSVQLEPTIDRIFDICVPAIIPGWSGPSVTVPFPLILRSAMMMWVRSAAAGTVFAGAPA